MGKLLIQYRPEVMLFDSLEFDNTSDVQRIIIKGYDVHDRDMENDMMAWVFDTKTVPIKSLENLKQGDLLFWQDGELLPVTFPREEDNVYVFKKRQAS